MLGSQLGTRVLPKLSDALVSRIFVVFLASMAVLNLWQAWKSYTV